MSNDKGAFFEYWLEKKMALSLVQPEIFMNNALKYGYFPEAGVLPDFFETTYNTSSYKSIRPSKKGQKYKLNAFELVKFTHTNGSGYRVYSLIHPFQYWLLCKEISDNLPRIVKILTKQRNIVSYSIPDLMSLELRREYGIKAWLRMAEEDLISESGGYAYLLKADITTFYDSIYTHSISWAIHGEGAKKKQNRKNYLYLGNRLDKLAQYSNNGQTNGLPIGPITSDILCELVLASLDETVSKKLNKLRINYRAARYKDDYRFLTQSHEDASRIKKILTETLNKYGMSINQNKTTISNDIVESYSRDWKQTLYKFGLDNIQPANLEQVSSILDGIYRHQKETVGKQPALSLMEDLYQYAVDENISSKFNRKIAKEIISKLIHLYRLMPSILPYSIQLLDLLLEGCDDETKKEYIEMFAIYFSNITDDDSIAWLYRLYLRISKVAADNFLSNTLKKDSKMKDLLQKKWIFDDDRYNSNGFLRKSVSFISDDSIKKAKSQKIKVGFRYTVNDYASTGTVGVDHIYQ